MKGIRHVIGLVIMLMGVISVNAIPFVPHHHHDGKICVEIQDSDTANHDSEEGDNFHSEESEYDVPDYGNKLIGNEIIISILPSILAENINGSFKLISGFYTPYPDYLFLYEKYAADSQSLRGSPFFLDYVEIA